MKSLVELQAIRDRMQKQMDAQDIVVVSVMPCAAKKYEIKRKEQRMVSIGGQPQQPADARSFVDLHAARQGTVRSGRRPEAPQEPRKSRGQVGI